MIHTIINDILANNQLGDLLEIIPIKGGTQNKSYRLHTSLGQYVITDYQRNDKADLPTILALVNFLHSQQFPCPRVIADNNHQLLQQAQDKFFVISELIQGEHIRPLNAEQAFAVGKYLAIFHQSICNKSLPRNNMRQLTWITATSEKLYSKLSSIEQKLLLSELSFQQAQNYQNLPRGIIHSDLFRDNILFTGNELSGIIDYYDMCEDYLLLDIGVATVGCCRIDDNEIDDYLSQQLLTGYNSIKQLCAAEVAATNAMQRLGVLGFWLTRLHHQHFGTATYDPAQLQNVLAILSKK